MRDAGITGMSEASRQTEAQATIVPKTTGETATTEKEQEKANYPSVLRPASTGLGAGYPGAKRP